MIFVSGQKTAHSAELHRGGCYINLSSIDLLIGRREPYPSRAEVFLMALKEILIN